MSAPYAAALHFAAHLAHFLTCHGYPVAAQALRRTYTWKREGSWTTLVRAQERAAAYGATTPEELADFFAKTVGPILRSKNFKRRFGEQSTPALPLLCLLTQVRLPKVTRADEVEEQKPLDVAALCAYWDRKVAQMAATMHLPVWQFVQLTAQSNLYDPRWLQHSPLVQQLRQRRLLRDQP